VIALPREIIEQRFNLTGDGGAAYAAVGDCTNGIAGGGFIYTNLDSISIGVVLRLDDLARSGESSSDLHDRFLAHPAIAPLVRDGELVEYGSHLVAEGGQAMVHDLARPGLVVVGDAAGFTLNTGFTLRGMDLAAGSAVAAARAVNAALDARDYSQHALDAYPAELRSSFVGRDMATYAHAPAFFENPRLYNDYGPLIADMLHGVYDLDTTPRRRLARGVISSLRRSPLKVRHLARDAVAAARAL
jgi:electron transfer flavoprotein-quinone oxidoreductase